MLLMRIALFVSFKTKKAYHSERKQQFMNHKSVAERAIIRAKDTQAKHRLRQTKRLRKVQSSLTACNDIFLIYSSYSYYK